eukprot:980971-Karenia_brevis.AAC.1
MFLDDEMTMMMTVRRGCRTSGTVWKVPENPTRFGIGGAVRGTDGIQDWQDSPGKSGEFRDWRDCSG